MMQEQKRFSQKEVNRIFRHIPSKTLRWWGQMELYGWVGETSDSRGISREYDLGNLYQIGIVAELSSINIPSSMIKVIMCKFFRTNPMPNPTINFDLWKDDPYGGTDEEHYEGMTYLESPFSDITKLMDNVLFITKDITKSANFSQQNLKYKPLWSSDLIPKDEYYLDFPRNTVIYIAIDLANIKKLVDNLISYQ